MSLSPPRRCGAQHPSHPDVSCDRVVVGSMHCPTGFHAGIVRVGLGVNASYWVFWTEHWAQEKRNAQIQAAKRITE